MHLNSICGRTRDNSTYDYGTLNLLSFSSTVVVYPNIVGSAWTASGIKEVYGQFWYEKS